MAEEMVVMEMEDIEAGLQEVEELILELHKIPHIKIEFL
jgi:hypothetical protein